MATRKVEIFTAGCACCDETVQLVKQIACPSCEVAVLDMKEYGGSTAGQATWHPECSRRRYQRRVGGLLRRTWPDRAGASSGGNRAGWLD